MEEFTDVLRKLWDATEPGAMLWDAETGQVGDPARVHSMSHQGRFFKVEGPLNTPPSPQGRPVLIQAGGSPRGIRASAYVADHVFGADMALPLQIRQRAALDQALTDLGRDPSGVGILWQTPIVVAETQAEADRRRDQLLTAIPPEAVGAYLSYNIGYDLSTLPARFTIAELHDAIVARNASPQGFVHELGAKLGRDAEITARNSSSTAPRPPRPTTRPLPARPPASPTTWNTPSKPPAAAAASCSATPRRCSRISRPSSPCSSPSCNEEAASAREYRTRTLREHLAEQ